MMFLAAASMVPRYKPATAPSVPRGRGETIGPALSHCAPGRTRTGMAFGRGILSPLRLPISPPGHGGIVAVIRATKKPAVAGGLSGLEAGSESHQPVKRKHEAICAELDGPLTPNLTPASLRRVEIDAVVALPMEHPARDHNNKAAGNFLASGILRLFAPYMGRVLGRTRVALRLREIAASAVLI